MGRGQRLDLLRPQIPLTGDELDAREVAATRDPGLDAVARTRCAAGTTTSGPASSRQPDTAGHRSRLARRRCACRTLRAGVENYLRSAPLHFAHTGSTSPPGSSSTPPRTGASARPRSPSCSPAVAGSAAVDAHLRAVADASTVRRPAVDSVADIRRRARRRPPRSTPTSTTTDGAGRRSRSARTDRRRTARTRRRHRERCRRAGDRRGQRSSARCVRRFPTPTATGSTSPRRRRASYALRDDDVGVCWNWPLGLVRRAGLEMGRRLVDRGVLADRGTCSRPRSAKRCRCSRAGRPVDPDAGSSPDDGTRSTSGEIEPPLHLDGGGERAAVRHAPAGRARLTAIRDALWSAAPTASTRRCTVSASDRRAVGRRDRASPR